MDELLAKVTELQELDDKSVKVTMVLSAEGLKRIRASMKRFHKTNSLADEVAELMKFAIIKTTSK